jgi:hypothetical protein
MINNHRAWELTQITDIVDIIIELAPFDSTSHVDIAETSNNILGKQKQPNIIALLIFSLHPSRCYGFSYIPYILLQVKCI